jgi:4-hydroxy-2-oxoheptanedioate aldolase
VANRINRAVELLEQDQAIYCIGEHTGHVLTYEQGREDAGTWADYINVGMEHGASDMTGLAEYMRGLIDAGPTTSGHRAPTVIVELPVGGTDEANVRFNSWQIRQVLARGVHGILLCQAENAAAVRAFVESCRYPVGRDGVDESLPSALDVMRGAAHTVPTGPGAARRRHPRSRLRADRGAGLHITVPLLRPVTFYLIVVGVVGAMPLFVSILALTYVNFRVFRGDIEY